MHATIRRYEGVDLTRTDELVSNVNETLVPQLRELARLFRLLPARRRQRRPELGQSLPDLRAG